MSVPENYYPISDIDQKRYVFGVCSCPKPVGYYHRTKFINGQYRYKFHCDNCGEDIFVEVPRRVVKDMKYILTDAIAEKLMELTEEQLAEKIFNGAFDGIFSCNDCPAKGLCNNMLPGPFGKPNGLTCKDVLIKFMKED